MTNFPHFSYKCAFFYFLTVFRKFMTNTFNLHLIQLRLVSFGHFSCKNFYGTDRLQTHALHAINYANKPQSLNTHTVEIAFSMNREATRERPPAPLRQHASEVKNLERVCQLLLLESPI